MSQSKGELRQALRDVHALIGRGEIDAARVRAAMAIDLYGGHLKQMTNTDRVCTCLTNQRGPCPVHGGVALPR